MKPDYTTKTDEELKQFIKKGTVARKVVRKKLIELRSQTWALQQGKWSLDGLIYNSKKELGKRKGSKCKALKQVRKQEWGGMMTHYSCVARELSFNYFSRQEDIFVKYCCNCKWKPSQVQTRMMILRIKNGRKN